MPNTTADLVPFEALLESTNEGLYGVDLEGRCTFLNRAGAKMLGFTRYEVLGRNMHRLVHHSHEDGSHYPEQECPIAECMRTREAVRVENEVLWPVLPGPHEISPRGDVPSTVPLAWGFPLESRYEHLTPFHHEGSPTELSPLDDQIEVPLFE